MPNSWLPAISGQDRSSLLLHSRAQMVLVLQMQRYQLVVAMEQMLDGAFAYQDLPRLQLLMDFADTSMFSIAQPSHQRDDIQPTFSMGQRPSTFFFWTVGLLVT